MRIIYWWNKLTKQRHWFHVQFFYLNKEGVAVAQWEQYIGLREFNTIYDKRTVKKILNPIHEDEFYIPVLSNGILDFKVLSYLGKFKEGLEPTATE